MTWTCDNPETLRMSTRTYGDGTCPIACRPCDDWTKYPGPPPKNYLDTRWRCCQMPSKTCRVPISLPQDKKLALDHNAPVVIDWPPAPQQQQPEEVDTGPRPDLLAMIPDDVVPQTVTLMAQPDITYVKTTDPHPLCPDGQLHLQIDPPPPKKSPEIKIPEVEAPIRGPPCRPWIQCVENHLITDRVRRPLARTSFKRELPPIVIPASKLAELKAKSNETLKEKEQMEKWCQERECERIRSRERQAKWNYTVESLLERKRQKDREKQEKEEKELHELMEEMNAQRQAESKAQIDKANRKILYRKGLIRDFNSALAYSKMMQEIENMKQQSQSFDDSNRPLYMQKRTKRMMYPNMMRPSYDHLNSKQSAKPCDPKLLKTLQAIEERSKEQQNEVNLEVCAVQQIYKDNYPEWPEAYKKYIQTPNCDLDKIKREQAQKRMDIFHEIGEKLTADAFIECHEKERQRQAHEFNDYKKKVDAIRKYTDKKLIDDKVAYNIAKSEAAAKVLVQMQKRQLQKSSDYDKLRDEWAQEWSRKFEEKQSQRLQKLETVMADFVKRKKEEEVKRCELDPARQWARENLIAVENYEKQCEEKSEKKKKAEEIALFNREMANSRHVQKQQKKYMDDVWGWKIKNEYWNEMKEMKAYAEKCIEDWKSKGRSELPMRQAMKKWEYDSGMYPFLFNENELDKDRQCRWDKKGSSSEPAPETTSERLGFYSGGC